MTKRSWAHRLDNKICRIRWWLHKHALWVCLLSGVIAVGLLANLIVSVSTGPRLAVMGWDDIAIYLAIMIATSLIAAATAPKPKDPEAIKATAPVVKDGVGIKRVYGTVWIDDSIVLGWQQLGTDPIKSSGGKK